MKRFFFSLFIFFCFLLFTLFIKKSIDVRLPKPDEAPFFYSNQTRHDLRQTIYTAIKNAKESIFLITFGLSDNKIIELLKEKDKKNFALKIFFDERSSKKITFPKSEIHSVKKNGLMHQKVLVIDKKWVYLGSTNFTKSSFLMHNNLIIGFFSPEVARFLSQNAPFYSNHLKTLVGGQDFEIFLLPDKKKRALLHLKKLISDAQKTIKVGMFSLTHPFLVDELIKAQKKGVDVEILIDSSSSKAKVMEKLKNEHVKVFEKKAIELFHHKFILIDNRIFISGSANWSKAAFNKNFDLFFILYNLEDFQKKYINRIWSYSFFESKPLKK